MKRPTTARARGEWQGMNWIRQEKRLAIYLRDGLACAWCGAAVEDAECVTLDHLVPHCRGGSNSERNLVTACKRCNSSRAERSAPAFAKAVAAYLNRELQAAEILGHVRECARRPLAAHLASARALIASRGSAAKAVAGGLR